MEIKFLKKAQQVLPIAGRVLEGVPVSEIEAVEAKLNIKLPEAYREFLLLAGRNLGGLLLDTADLKTVSADWFHKLIQENMEERGISIDKPYWIFSHSDDFLFFYLEDGVKNHLIYYTYTNSNKYSTVHDILPYNKPFSELISMFVDYSVKAYKTGIW